MKKLVIFGSGDIAQLAHYYFKTDSAYDVAAFTVDSAYINENTFCDLPVVAFEKVKTEFPPEHFDLFVALSYSKVNAIRKEKYLSAKGLGYKLTSYISSKATILNERAVGENCFILEDNTIQPFVRIGNNVTLWSGNHIGHHSSIEDHCFIASHVVVSGGVEIGEQCFVGVNATIRDHIKIGERSILGAGTLIMASTAAESVYIGPATEPRSIQSSQIKRI